MGIKQKKHWIPRISSIIVLALFVISLMPLGSIQTDEPDVLRAAILQVQKLHQSPDVSTTDFKEVFTNTVIALQSSAGLQACITCPADPSDADSLQIIVYTRVPYLLSPSSLMPIEVFSQKLPPGNYHFSHQSHTVPPETPPPILS